MACLPKNFFAGRLDTENSGAEINPVEIKRENLVLGVTRLQIDRQHRFLDFALESAAGREEQILGELLGEGRTALHHMPRHHVGDAGARHADGIKTEMIAEAAVFNRDEGVGDIVRQVFGLDHLALCQAAAGDLIAVIVQDGDVACWPGGKQIFDIGQFGEKMRIENRPENRPPDQQQAEDKRPGGFAFAWRRRVIIVAIAPRLRVCRMTFSRADAWPCPLYRTARVNGG